MVVNIGNQNTTFTFASSQLHFLSQGDTVASAGNGIVNAAFTGAELIIAGDVFADGWGMQISTGADNMSTLVTQTGLVQGASYGVVFSASGTGSTESVLNNNGSIAGYAVTGVYLADADNNTITNTGDIFGANEGIYYRPTTDTAGLINSGLISGGVGVRVEGTEVRILNTGEIMGDASSSGSENYGIVVSNSGFQLSNAGVVGGTTGAFLGSSFRDVVFNSGEMLGAVAMGNGNDVYRAVGDGSVNGGVRGGDGDDELTGGSAVDDLGGGSGRDKMRGNEGDDYLGGDSGRDLMFGGAGDDVIEGGADGDLMLGGAGADEFLYTDVDDIGTSGATRDEIRDFEQGMDIINLAAMVGPDFIFLGSSGFTGGSAPELRLAEAGGNTFVQLDYDGDGSQDGRLLVRGVLDMTEADFIL